MEDLIQKGVNLFLQGEKTLTEIRVMLGLRSTTEMAARLEELGYKMYRGAKAQSVIGLKAAVEEYIANYDNLPSCTKIAAKYGISRETLSNRLKELDYEVVNHQNKVKFDENIFDCIDTEEKAYWLGFIYADGYISSSPLEKGKKSQYDFEISLKEDDSTHLEKFKIFLKSELKVKHGKVKCGDKICGRCRFNITNKHLWTTLNNYGCTPRKSLTLQFPSEDIFADKSLIRHFIRGYFDGDGCISYVNKEHTVISISVLGTENFLELLRSYTPVKDTAKLFNHDKATEITKVWSLSRNKAFELIYFLYENSTIYLDRKYERYQYFCRLYEQSYRKLSSNIGEGCDANTEVISEIA